MRAIERPTVLSLCLMAPGYALARFLFELLMAHHIDHAWLQAHTKSALLDAAFFSLTWYIVGNAVVWIRERRARKNETRTAD